MNSGQKQPNHHRPAGGENTGIGGSHGFTAYYWNFNSYLGNQRGGEVMELIKGYARAQAAYEAQTDQMPCGCDRGFCDCDERGGEDDTL